MLKLTRTGIEVLVCVCLGFLAISQASAEHDFDFRVGTNNVASAQGDTGLRALFVISCSSQCAGEITSLLTPGGNDAIPRAGFSGGTVAPRVYYGLEPAEVGEYTLTIDTPAGEVVLQASLTELLELERPGQVVIEPAPETENQYVVGWLPVSNAIEYSVAVLSNGPVPAILASESTADLAVPVMFVADENDVVSVVVRATNFSWRDMPDYPMYSETHVFLHGDPMSPPQ